MSITETLAAYGAGELVPLPDIGRAVGLDADRQSYAIRKGLIRPVSGKRGPNGRYLITRDEAAMILAAAALAIVAGIAVVTMLRTLRAAGAVVSGESITIPLAVAQ